MNVYQQLILTHGQYAKNKLKEMKEEKINSDKADVSSCFSLVDAERFEGFSKHPAADNTVRKVKEATIKPIEYSSTGWVYLEIQFNDGERFIGSSPSVRGAKQMFAFQCRKGSKWEAKNYY